MTWALTEDHLSGTAQAGLYQRLEGSSSTAYFSGTISSSECNASARGLARNSGGVTKVATNHRTEQGLLWYQGAGSGAT